MSIPFIQLARPWTPEQWAFIVTTAKRIRELRKQARHHRAVEWRNRHSLYDTGGSRTAEWKARNLEAHLRNLADVRLKDIDDAALDNYLTTKETT